MKVKKAYILMPIVFFTMILILLFMRINHLENIVNTLEKDIENKNTSQSEVKASIDSLQNKLDTLEANSNRSQKYYDVISERLSESEFEFLMDSFLENSPVNLHAYLESLKIYVHVLEETLKYSEGIKIKYALELLEISEVDGYRRLEIRDYVSNKLESVEIASDCEFYLGSQFYRHKTTLDNLITPGEPLEAGLFTLVYVDDVVKYIFTGRTY